MRSWLWENKQWVFSGIGVFVLGLLWKLFSGSGHSQTIQESPKKDIPQIRVRYRGHGAGSGADLFGNMLCYWTGELEFYNTTAFDALNLNIEWPLNKPHLPINALEPPHVKALTTVKVSTRVEKSFPREQVINCKDRSKELLPDEIKTIELILSYTNSLGKIFYTLYRNVGEGKNEKCTYHDTKPTFKEHNR